MSGPSGRGHPSEGTAGRVIHRRGARLVAVSMATAGASAVVVTLVYAAVHTTVPGTRVQRWSLMLLVVLLSSIVAVALHTLRPAWRELSAQAATIERENRRARRELEQELQRVERYAHELEGSVGDLRTFAYAASHDLKEPVRTVISHLQLLKRRSEGQLDDEATDRVDTAIAAAYRMNDLVEGLLTYTDAGRRTAPFQRVDLGEVVSDAVANLDAQIEESEARIDVGELPEVYGDRPQLVQLMQNLLGNAMKFAGEEPPRIRVLFESGGDMYQFAVEDEGLGFDAESEGRIFDMFQRGDTTVPGTGVGLAVSRRIVRRHHGEIWAESTPGQGATFRFTLLPARDDEDPPDPRDVWPSEETMRDRSRELI